MLLKINWKKKIIPALLGIMVIAGIIAPITYKHGSFDVPKTQAQTTEKGCRDSERYKATDGSEVCYIESFTTTTVVDFLNPFKPLSSPISTFYIYKDPTNGRLYASSSLLVGAIEGDVYPLHQIDSEIAQELIAYYATDTEAAIKQEAELRKKDPPCGITDVKCGVIAAAKEVVARALAYIAFASLTILSLLVAISGYILDFSIEYTVVKMSANIDGITALDTAWTALRDIANMGFIFILLYASIATILQSSRFDTKRVITNVIIVGLLINFSLFFTKVVIDASNILAITFHEKAKAACVITDLDSNLSKFGSDISVCFAQSLGITTIMQTSDNLAKDNNAFSKIFALGIGGSLILVIAIFVFLAASVLFLVRYAVLIILMILSPLAFLGYILPQTSGQTNKWWRSLTGQAIFAPAYLLLTYLVLLIISDKGFLGLAKTGDPDGKGFSKILSNPEGSLNGPDSVGIFVNFFIVTIFLIATIVIAKQFSSWSGAAVGKATKKLNGYMGKATFGSAAYAGRQTAGRLGNRIANSKTLQDAAPNSTLARLALRTGKKAGAASYDARSSGVAGLMGDAADVDFGKGSGTGGYKKSLDDRKKKELEFAKDLGELDDNHPEVEPLKTIENAEKLQLETEKAILQQLKLNGAPPQDIAQQAQIVAAQQQSYSDAGQAVSLKKKQRQAQYAGSLQNRGRVKRWLGFGGSKNSNKQAAKAILDEMNKGKNQQTLDEILAQLNQQQGQPSNTP